MDLLTQYFDHYVISARIRPALLVVLPLAVVVIVWWPETRQAGGALIAFMVSFGVISFLSNHISNAGNILQVRLFEEWGGAPTTSLLRHKDSTLDAHTKQRYYRKIETLLPYLKMPTKQEELADSDLADECYASAVGFLREKSRNKTVFTMVYRDNVAYGFARNVYLLKPWGVVSASISLVLSLLLLYFQWESLLASVIGNGFPLETVLKLMSLIFSLVLLFVFTFAVNSEFVRGRAIRYAKSLLAVCEDVER